MRRTFGHLLDNLGSMILALLLAFVIWIAATLQVDPFVGEALTNVPIALFNQADDTVLFEPIDQDVDVEIRAPQSVLRDLDVADFRVTMDLAEAQPGVPQEVTVEVTSTNDAVRILTVEPQAQTVHLEAVQTITLPVTLDVRGQVPTGYQAGPPKITPEEVTVYGAAPSLRQVVSVTSSIDIQGAKADVSEQVVATPRDANGRLVAGVQWTPDQVQIDVRVRRRVGYKPDVEVVPDLQVMPAPGYRLGSVAADPSVVTLKGPPSVLDNMPGFIKTLPISITDATANLVEHRPLTMPASVVVVGVNYVTVTVEVLPIQSSRTMTGLVEIQGVPPEWTATASPDVVDVILEGPDSVLAELGPDDLQILLNLFDYPLGVHRVQPVVLAPEDVTVVSVIPETIEVAIGEPPGPSVPTYTLPIAPTEP
jgi:YbbR domain-containing protein